MPDNTATVEPEVQEAPDTHEPLTIDGKEFSLLGTTMKKGRGKGKVIAVLEAPDGDYAALHASLREVVGPANWDKIVYSAVVRQACIDATAQTLKDSEDGRLDETALAKNIKEWFLPGSRVQGERVKDLREKAQEIYGELNPLLLRHFQHKPGEEGSLNEEEQNRMLQLTLEYSEVNAKIENKSRKGKGGKK